MAINDPPKMKFKTNPEVYNSCNQKSSKGVEEDEIDEEELDSINNQLDQLNMALDELEQKNNNIHAQLIQLLESNRQARKHFQQIQDLTNVPEQKEQQN